MFLGSTDNYTLRGIDLLKPEEEETKTIDLSKEKPEKREYIMEVYVRNLTWEKQAKEALGDMCIFKKCNNTFLRDDVSRYIEVHHIIPLYKGGKDSLWNLSALYAQHHQMARYCDEKTKINIEKYFLSEVKTRLFLY